jgi:hypothetical protein
MEEELSGSCSALVLDCLTLWLSNLFMKTQSKGYGLHIIETEIQKLLDSLRQFKSSTAGEPGSFVLCISSPTKLEWALSRKMKQQGSSGTWLGQ